MIFGKMYKSDMIWKRWFAWYPVILEDGRTAWFSTIYRRYSIGYDYVAILDEVKGIY